MGKIRLKWENFTCDSQLANHKCIIHYVNLWLECRGEHKVKYGLMGNKFNSSGMNN